MVREASRPVREGKWGKSFGYSYIDALESPGKAPRGRPVRKGRRASGDPAKPGGLKAWDALKRAPNGYISWEEATWRVPDLGLRRRADMAESSAGRK